MTPDTSTLKAAIDRSLAELNNAILKQIARDTLIEQDITYARMSFFVIAEDALHSDMISHAIRVLDGHRDASSFWYVYRCNETSVKRHAARNQLDIDRLRVLSAKLRIVRDKTKFHIDRAAVKDSKRVWKDADISGGEFITALRALAGTLAGVRLELFGGKPHELTEYDGSDVPKIVKAYESLHGGVHGA